MQRIAFIDWSNYPYGGDTTYISSFKELSDLNGVPLDIYFYESSRHKRDFEYKPNQQTGVNFYHFSKKDIYELFEKLKKYDFVCFVQTPFTSIYSKKEREFIFNEFNNLPGLKGLQAHIFAEPMVAFSTDLFNYIVSCDILITREDDEMVPMTAIGKKLGKTIIPLTLYSDLNKFTDNTKKKNKLLYRGRYDRHKRPFILGNLSYHLKKNPSIEFEMMGIDATIGAFDMIHIREWAITYRYPEKIGGWVKVTPPFKHSEGIEEMKKSLFGFSPRTKLSGSYLEYSQIEVLQCGGILILSKKEGENSFTPDGKRWIDIPYFAVWLDEENLENTANEIDKILENDSLKELYKSTPKKIFEPILSQELFKKHLAMILKADKTENTIKEMLKSFDWKDENIDQFIEINNQYIVSPFIKHLQEKELYVFVKGIKKPVQYKSLDDEKLKNLRI